jgi:hypothetical protein
MRHRGQRVVRAIVALLSFALAWWLLYDTGNWPNHSASFAQFLLLFLCVTAIDRILSATVDLTVIALGHNGERAPRDT